ncbi:MAG: YciI family protein [Pseudomonadales bacterium]|nr:YciI family protein [Pseudomonadales bacterium]
MDAHVIYLQKFYAQKIFLFSGRKVPRTGGVIMANCANRQQLQKIIEQDPFYLAAVARFKITEMIPTMTAENLEMFKQYI